MIAGSKIVSLHVYDDGDVELTKHNEIPTGMWGTLYFDEENVLRAELRDYGYEDDRIERALKNLETQDQVTI